MHVPVPKTEASRTLLMHALADHFLFAQLQPADLAACVGVMGALECEAGEDVVVQGQEGKRFFVLEAGTAEVGKTGEREGGELAGSTCSVMAVVRLSRSLEQTRGEIMVP